MLTVDDVSQKYEAPILKGLIVARSQLLLLKRIIENHDIAGAIGMVNVFLNEHERAYFENFQLEPELEQEMTCDIREAALNLFNFVCSKRDSPLQ